MINPEGRMLLELGDAPVRSLRDLSSISQIDFVALMARPDNHLDNELCISSPAGKRWLAIGNRRLSGAVASRGSSGRPALESIWILRDISAGKLAEQERESARSAMALAEVSSILAHEIRNPLASMELFAGLIADDPQQTTQWVSHLRAGIRLLTGTVNNVLSVHCGNSLHLAPVNLTACTRRGVEFVRPIADQAGVTVFILGDDAELMIQGNENGISQILLNLICNAIRHTPSGGKITVLARRIAQKGTALARVDIADTGCGIPQHFLEHLFEAGFSAEGNTPGLGLAVCKRLMTQHSGEIRVTSQVGRGTTFRLEFPAL
jgi:two-component system sensor histidine kinase FlrB